LTVSTLMCAVYDLGRCRRDHGRRTVFIVCRRLVVGCMNNAAYGLFCPHSALTMLRRVRGIVTVLCASTCECLAALQCAGIRHITIDGNHTRLWGCGSGVDLSCNRTCLHACPFGGLPVIGVYMWSTDPFLCALFACAIRTICCCSSILLCMPAYMGSCVHI
jgi:hypothetical protein